MGNVKLLVKATNDKTKKTDSQDFIVSGGEGLDDTSSSLCDDVYESGDTDSTNYTNIWIT